MFTTRLISGIVLVLIALVVVGSGGMILFAATVAISMIGLFELYRVMKIQKNVIGIAGYLTVVSYYGLLWFHGEQYMMLMSIAFLMILMTIYVFTFPKYKTEEVTVAFFGVFYVAVMLSYLYQVRVMADGKYLVWLIFLSSWGCDTCAYCVGMLIGKHKMAPKLSPKKSVEGGIGGIAGAALIAVLYALAINHWGNAGVSVASFAIIGAAGGAISQIGDLAASAIKRNHDIKDYGKLIPGHGGILDRFDSIIFTAPIIFYLSVLL